MPTEPSDRSSSHGTPILARLNGDLSRLNPALIPQREARLLADVARWFPDAFAQLPVYEVTIPSARWNRRPAADLTFRIDRGTEAAAVLAGTHPTQSLPEPMRTHPAWTGLQSFFRAWAGNDQSATGRTSMVWLAFDQPDLPGRVPVPGVSVGIDPTGIEPDSALALLDLLIPDGNHRHSPGLRAILGADPELRLAYLGANPSRSRTACRAIVQTAAGEPLRRVIDLAHFPGHPDASRTLEWVAGDISSFNLSFDFDIGTSPRLGAELSTSGSWPQLARGLGEVTQRCIDIGAVDANPAWAAIHSIGQSLDTNDPDSFRHCRISHIKTVFEPSGELVMKSYIGVLAAPMPPRSWQADEAAMLPAAIERARQFLVASQSGTGAWCGRVDRNGFAANWVTGYVAEALAEERSARSLAAARRGWNYLVDQLGPDGWSYDGHYDADADSTTWAVRAGSRLGEQGGEPWQRGLAALEAFVTTDGGVRSWNSSNGRSILTDGNMPGYIAAAGCITAAAAALPEFAGRALDWLRRAQDEDGGWPAFWWIDREYPTALAVQALLQQEEPARDWTHLQRARTWLLSRISRDGCVRDLLTGSPSPFLTALVCQALAELGDPAAQPLADWLFRAQLSNGSWAASDWLAFTPAFITSPADVPVQAWVRHAFAGTPYAISTDGTGLWTTATVLRALVAVRAGSRLMTPAS